LLNVQLEDGFLLRAKDGKTALVSVSNEQLKLEHTFKAGETFGTTKTRDGKSILMSVAMQEQEVVMGMKSGSDAVTSLPPCPQLSRATNGGVVNVFLNAFTKRDGSIGTRTLVVSEDHALTLIQNGNAVWKREEGLASIRKVEFVDLPYSKAATGADSSIVTNLLDKVSGKNVPSLAGAHVEDYSVASGKPKALFTDKFQIRKLAIAMTAANKVFAINTETSEIVWTRFFSAAALGSLVRLFVLRNTYSGEGFNPECLIVGSDAKSSSRMFVASFNPLSGDIVQSQTLPYKARHMVMLPDLDTQHRHLLMIVDSALRAHAFPNTEEARSTLSGRVGSLFWFDVDRTAHTLTGYRVVNHNRAFESERTWHIAFPETEKIDAIAARSLEDNIFSPFYTTGSHDVLQKYINPNMLAVSTVSTVTPFFKGTRSQPSSSAVNPSVHLYVVDTVTGHMLYHVANPNSKGPTNLAMAENWVAHTYWSDRHLRTELSVLELWEDQEEGDMLTNILRGIGLEKGPATNALIKRKHFTAGNETKGKFFSSFHGTMPQKEE
jgi:hypothetical protein